MAENVDDRSTELPRTSSGWDLELMLLDSNLVSCDNVQLRRGRPPANDSTSSRQLILAVWLLRLHHPAKVRS